MRRDSFKNVRFGGLGSRTSSKSSSPKTLIQNTPPSNPYRDIQQALPNQSFFFSHDSIVLWIFLLSIYHLLSQTYLIFGTKIRLWHSITLTTSICCIFDECFALLYKESSDILPTRRYSWKETILKSKMPILLNCIISMNVLISFFVYKDLQLIKGLLGLGIFNLGVLLRRVDRSLSMEVCQTRTSIKKHQFRIDDTKNSILSSIFRHIISCLWISVKLCLYSCLVPVVGVFFDNRWLLYSRLDLILHSFFFLLFILPFILLFDFEPNLLSWMLRIRSWRNDYLRKDANQPITGIMHFLVKMMETEFSQIRTYKGKHSVLSLNTITAATCWLFVEIFWYAISSSRRMNKVLILGIIIHMAVIGLFIHSYNVSPHFIRRSSDPSATSQQSQPSHSTPNHQHPIINEFEKNLKVALSQIHTPDELKERHADYLQRMNELYDSPNVQLMIQRSRQPNSPTSTPLSKPSGIEAVPSITAPSARQKKNSNNVTTKNTQLNSQTHHSPTSVSTTNSASTQPSPSNTSTAATAATAASHNSNQTKNHKKEK